MDAVAGISMNLWGVGGQATHRGVAAGGSVFHDSPRGTLLWHVCVRIRAAMRTAPGARKLGPDDTYGLREWLA
eukprot:gene16751-biopygen20315